MAAEKIINDKEVTLGGILVSATVMLLLGVFVGFAYLTSFPVRIFSSVNEYESFLDQSAGKPPSPKDIFYFKGPELRGRSWETKRRQLLDSRPTSVSITDGELNAWMGSKFRQPVVANTEEEPYVLILPAVPNFFIVDEESFYISISTDIIFFGNKGTYMVFAKGHFSDKAPVKFVMDELRVNSAPIPVVAGIANQVMKVLMKAYSKSEEFEAMRAAWERVDSVELESNVIRLQLR